MFCYQTIHNNKYKWCSAVWGGKTLHTDSCSAVHVCVQVFSLPKVSAKMKLKLTAVDGSRVRRVGVAWFGSSRSEDYGESGLVVLTNQGDLHVVSLPTVKMQVQYPCIRREDVSGIASCVFTKHGQGKDMPTHTLTHF